MRLLLPVVVTLVAFAANSVLNRLALLDGATGPLGFAALRLLSGAAMLAVLVLTQGGAERLWRAVSPAKAAALMVYMLGFSLAYRSLDAGLGALILFGGVQLTMVAGAVLSGEAMTPRRVAGSLISLAGLTWLLWPAGPVVVPLAAAGLMLAAALGWGLYSLMGRGAGDPLATTAAAFLLASFPALLAALVARDGLGGTGAMLAVLSGALTSGLGYALWYRLLPHLAASTAAVAQLTVPPIAIAGGALILGEAPGWGFLAATVVVLGGVLIAVLPKRA